MMSLATVAIEGRGRLVGARSPATRSARPAPQRAPARRGQALQAAPGDEPPLPASAGGDQQLSKREMDFARTSLEQLFYSAPEAPEDAPSQLGDSPDHPLEQRLPLWRVGCAFLPGFEEVLSVVELNYCHMFKKICSGPRPWRFGWLYIPGGAQRIGTKDYELRPGTRAPLVGTLMDISEFYPLDDGRVLLKATGIARFWVKDVVQEAPYTIADILPLQDDEEVDAHREAATLNAMQEADTDDPQTGGIMAAVAAAEDAARAAAAAEAAAWHGFETGEHARVVGRGLSTLLSVMQSSLRVPPLMYDQVCLETLADAASKEAELAIQSVIRSRFTPLDSMDLDEESRAVTGVTIPFTGQRRASKNSQKAPHSGLNTVEERGIPDVHPINMTSTSGGEELMVPQGAVCTAGSLSRANNKYANLEANAWEAGVQLADLRAKVYGKGSDRGGHGLPAGLACLQGGQMHARYPALRRAQRVSFALAGLGEAVSAGEGRQALLEAPSTAHRLAIVLAALESEAKLLAAVSAVFALSSSGAPSNKKQEE